MHLLCLGVDQSGFASFHVHQASWTCGLVAPISSGSLGHYYEMQARPPLLLLLLLQGPACPVSLCFPLCLLSFSFFAWGLLPHIALASHGYICCMICVIYGNEGPYHLQLLTCSLPPFRAFPLNLFPAEEELICSMNKSWENGYR